MPFTVLHGAVHITLGLFILECLALVVEFFTFTEAEFCLDLAVLKVYLRCDEGVALLLLEVIY